VTSEQIATGFVVHPMTLTKWMRRADVDDGASPAEAPVNLASCGRCVGETGCWSRKTRSCGGQRRICRKPTCRERALPARERVRRRRNSRGGDLPGTHARPPALLPRPAAPVTDAERVEAYRANALFDAHRDDPEFGYRFLAEEAREAGAPMAERTAWRICSQHRLWCVLGKKKRGGPPVHDDLVDRDFTAEAGSCGPALGSTTYEALTLRIGVSAAI
jgi:hypothetical protein